jgi:hypothetical protein
MADSVERPFDSFRTAITDPDHFFGRSELLTQIRQSPFEVRVLLGGRRLGKTSVLRAVEWSLLDDSPGKPCRAFPVFLSLQVEQPKNLDNFRYILVARLREAMERWQQVPGAALREMYRQFLRQISGGEASLGFFKIKVTNPDYERQLVHDDFRQMLLDTIKELQEWGRQRFEGVCFILDESDFIARQDWADGAWSYFRGLKDTDTALKPFFGLLLSGYRDLKDYQQRAGSPLFNIAKVEWLTSFTDVEMRQLVEHRCRHEQVSLADEELIALGEWAGTHPYLLQQLLNAFFDNHRQQTPRTLKNLMTESLQHRARDFSRWWHASQGADGLVEAEQTVYRELIVQRECTAETLAMSTNLPVGKVADALQLLAGTGVIRQSDEEHFEIGSRLFKEWVLQQ